MKYLVKAWNLFRKIFRRPFSTYNRLRLRNKNFSIISKDCVGGMLAHELGIRFDSPTVNLYFSSNDFVKFCRDIKFYLSEPITEDKDTDKNFPVGLIGSDEKMIRIYFMHYDNFQQAKEKWYERASRINWDNLFFIMTDRGDEKTMKEFDSLPYKHKALLTCRNLGELSSAVKLDVKSPNGLGAPEVFAYKSVFSIWRAIDDWDYVSFFNS